MQQLGAAIPGMLDELRLDADMAREGRGIIDVEPAQRRTGLEVERETDEGRLDRDADGFGSVRLYGPSRNLVASKDCNGKNPCTVNFPLTVNKRTHYVIVARQDDGDVIVSAPIWYEP